MIELDALKEQLKLLGHELPEDQIVSILKEMNIDYDPSPAPAAAPVNRGATRASDGPLTLAGEGHAFLANLPAQQPGQGPTTWPAHSMSSYPAAEATWNNGMASAQPPHAGASMHAVYGDAATQLSANLHGMYLSRDAPEPASFAAAHHAVYPQAAAASSSSVFESTLSHGFAPLATQAAASQLTGAADLQGGSVEHASKQPYEWYGQLAGAAANPHLKLAQPKGPPHRSLLQELDQSATQRVPAGGPPGAAAAKVTADRRRSTSLWEEEEADTSSDEGHGDDVGQWSRRPPQPAHTTAGRPASAASAGHRASGAGGSRGQQHFSRGPKAAALPSGSEEESEEDEEGVYAGRRRSDIGSDLQQPLDVRSGAGARDMRGPGTRDQWGGAGGGHPLESLHTAKVSADRAALRAAAAAAMGAPVPSSRPAKYCWQEHLRGTSPSRSSVISLPRSNISAAASHPSSGRSQGPSGPKKVDRVKRYQELQQGWSKDSFLRHSHGTKPSASASSSRQPQAQSRKPLNFHTYFSALHAIEAADRDQMLKQARTKTKGDLKPGLGYEAPTSKRRDALRWEMRMRMQGQT